MHGGVLNGGGDGGGICERSGQAVHWRDCLALEQGFGSGEHRTNAEFPGSDGARVRDLARCRAVDLRDDRVAQCGLDRE
jgi:hypothetical protein